MKTVTAYTHPSPESTQQPDTWVNSHGLKWRNYPCYYTSVVDGPRMAVLAGPFRTHQEALDMVRPAKELAHQLDTKSVFYGFGTVKLATGKLTGKLNEKLKVNPSA